MSSLLPVLLAALWTVAVPPTESAAAQQQLTASLQITPDQLSHLIDRAVTAATQPLANKVDSRIDTLDARLDTLDARLDTMDARPDTRLDTLDGRLDTLDARLDTLDARLDAMNARPDARLDTLDGRLDTLDARLDAMNARPDTRLDTLDGRLDRLDARLDTMDSRLDIFHTSLNGLAEGYRTQDSELLSVNQRIHNQTSQMLEKARRLEDHQIQLQEHGSRLDTQKAQLDACHSMLDNHTSELGTHQTLLAEQTSQIGSHQSLLESHTSELGTQRTLLAEQTSQIGSHQSLLDSHASQLSTHQSLIDNHTSQIANTLSQLDTVVNRTELQQAQIDDNTAGLQNVSDSRDGPFRDCSDLPPGSASGVYLLQPGLNGTVPVPAYCDMDSDGGNWTVFQRRADVQPRQDFYQNWAAYKDGFGKLDSEFWWGLENIWVMTSANDRTYELRIDLGDFEDGKRYATYQDFSISSESDGYRLSLTNYVGDAGDAMKKHNSMRFSTKDKDNDNNTGSCAKTWKGAWWYNRCHDANLNGLYLGGPGTTRGEGVNWKQWRGHTYSLKTTTMKIRPT